ncbi:MAG TPA: 50S ribosomal protein L11 methyltransferase, partial [Gammaproteobacteria bacterium]|nr:50S ribosomal protein L11 methyltransferase [Gammaproteobacteria bacterium]
MAWNQLTLYASRAIAEQLSASLEDLGAVSVTLKEGGAEEILEPLPGETPLWRDTQVVGL